MDNIKIEKLKREQIQTRIIGIVLLCAGSVLYRNFVSFPFVFIPVALSFVGLIMTVRSFVHSKFAVLKQSAAPSQTVPSDNDSAEERKRFIEVLKRSSRYRSDDSIEPPEIISLENYFFRATPSYIGGGVDDAKDETHINWLYLQGYDIEKSISEYISFKPRINEYKEMNLTFYADFILRSFYANTTFFIIDSRELLPKDKTSFERLRNVAIENSIGIVEEVSRGIYHDFVEEKYYRLEVDEEWPGSADDAATYGTYHIQEITNKDALQ